MLNCLLIPHTLPTSFPNYRLKVAANPSDRILDASVNIKSIKGKKDQDGGLVWRAKDAKNYYVARYNLLEDNYRVYKVEKQRRSQLQSADVRQRQMHRAILMT
jgi:hypothetical protein